MSGRTALVVRLGWVDARRGAGLAAAAVAAVTAGVLLFVQPGHPGDWVGHWFVFTQDVRADLPVSLAVAATFAAWQAGRDHRRGAGETLTPTARPRWQPVLFGWGVVTAATVAGFAVAVGGLGLMFVARFASYTGTGWIAPLLVCVPALAAATALGTAIGTYLHGLVVAPLVGLATFLAVIWAEQFGRGHAWLATGSWTGEQSSRPIGSISALQLGWFSALAVLLLLLAVASIRDPGGRLAAIAIPTVALAAVTGLLLVRSPGPSDVAAATVQDSAAQAPVCDQEGPLRVCLAKENAFLLPGYARQVAADVSRITALPGAPTTAIDWDTGLDPDFRPGVIALLLDYGISLDGTADPGASVVGSALSDGQCDDISLAMDAAERAAVTWAQGSRVLLASDGISTIIGPDPAATRTLTELDALPPAVQRGWMIRYLAMIRSCDHSLAARLADPSDTAAWR